MTQTTKRIAEELLEFGEISARRFKNISLLNKLREHQIVNVIHKETTAQ